MCKRSELLNRIIRGQFKEAREGKINLNEEDPEILHRVIVFMYTAEIVLDLRAKELADNGHHLWSEWVNGTDEPDSEEGTEDDAWLDEYAADLEGLNIEKIRKPSDSWLSKSSPWSREAKQDSKEEDDDEGHHDDLNEDNFDEEEDEEGVDDDDEDSDGREGGVHVEGERQGIEKEAEFQVDVPCLQQGRGEIMDVYEYLRMRGYEAEEEDDEEEEVDEDGEEEEEDANEDEVELGGSEGEDHDDGNDRDNDEEEPPHDEDAPEGELDPYMLDLKNAKLPKKISRFWTRLRPSTSIADIKVIIQLYSAADRLFVFGLKDAAVMALLRHFNATSYLNDLEELMSIAVAIYSTTPSTDRGLRDAFMSVFGRTELKKLMKAEMHKSPGLLEDNFEAVTELAIELLRQTWKATTID